MTPDPRRSPRSGIDELSHADIPTTARVLRAGTDGQPPATARSSALTAGGLLMGMGLGGFVDGVVIHQILQWHHMGTAVEGHDSFPATTVASLEANTSWDGLFHAGTWVLTVVGLFLVWHALHGEIRSTWRTLVGLLLAGWGSFNVIEGLVNHQLLQIHHVRDDLGGPLSWDLAFLAFGALLIVAGLALRRSDRPRRGFPRSPVGGHGAADRQTTSPAR